MLRRLYVGGGAVLILGYLTWSLLGMEWRRPSREPVPTRQAKASSFGRSHTGYWGSRSGFGFGK